MADKSDDVLSTRPNYFGGQYLLAEDFNLQQNYLLARQRYKTSRLYVSGIIEGLEVKEDKEKVTIQPGSAIDIKGRLIVLEKQVTWNSEEWIKKKANNIGGLIYIEYNENPDEQQKGKKGEKEGYRRWKEAPKIEYAQTTSAYGVTIAKRDTKGGKTNPEWTTGEYSGIKLPSNKRDGGITMRTQERKNVGGSEKKLEIAVLSGPLEIEGKLRVLGRDNSIEGAGGLKVEGDSQICTTSWQGDKVRIEGALSIGSEYPSGEAKLVVDGNAFIKGELRSPVNDFMKAQYTMTGGGEVSWKLEAGGANGDRVGWFKWEKFVAGGIFDGGDGKRRQYKIELPMPGKSIAAKNVYDEKEREVNLQKGILLKPWDAVYAEVQTNGNEGTNTVEYKIINFKTGKGEVAGNRLLVGYYNGEGMKGLKIGTGGTLHSGGRYRESVIPSGTIVMWHSTGEGEQVPTGWSLCDGKNGTPDLRGRFISSVGKKGEAGAKASEGSMISANQLPLDELTMGVGGDAKGLEGVGTALGVRYTTQGWSAIRGSLLMGDGVVDWQALDWFGEEGAEKMRFRVVKDSEVKEGMIAADIGTYNRGRVVMGPGVVYEGREAALKGSRGVQMPLTYKPASYALCFIMKL